MIGREDHRVAALGEQFEQQQQVGMFEPRTGKRAECRFVFGQVADNLRLGARMRQHIEKIVNDHCKIGLVDLFNVVQQPFTGIGTDDFIEIEFAAPPLRLHLPLEEILFVAVLAPRLVVVEPQVRHNFVDSQRRQPGKNRIAGILGGGRKDTAIKILLFDLVNTVQYRMNHPPLVVTEIVDQDKDRFGIFVGHRKNLRFHQIVRQHGRIAIPA